MIWLLALSFLRRVSREEVSSRAFPLDNAENRVMVSPPLKLTLNGTYL